MVMRNRQIQTVNNFGNYSLSLQFQRKKKDIKKKKKKTLVENQSKLKCKQLKLF